MHPGLLSAEYHLLRAQGRWFYAVLFLNSHDCFIFHHKPQRKKTTSLSKLNETKMIQECDYPWLGGVHFPSEHFINHCTLLGYYFMDKPGNLRVEHFCLCQIYCSLDLQDKQHVAQYLGKLYFGHEKNRFQSQSPKCSIVYSKMIKGVFQIANSVSNNSTYMVSLRNLSKGD